MNKAGLFVGVGTFIHGFDELVEAADRAAVALNLDGFAQIGRSRVLPHRLAWKRFLPPDEIKQRIAAARVVICHGGMGLLGDAMRSFRPIIAVPRRGPTTRDNPAGDQLAFLQLLARRYPIRLCDRLDNLALLLTEVLAEPARVRYELGSDIPKLIASFLRR